MSYSCNNGNTITTQRIYKKEDHMNFDNVKLVYESTNQKTHYNWGLREYLPKVYQYIKETKNE